jgi:hypothetical protein
MIEAVAAFPGPDLAMGVPISKIHDGAMLLGTRTESIATP